MLKKLIGTKSIVVISVVMLFALLASTSQSQGDVTRVCCDKDQSIVKLRERVASDLYILASELSVMLTEDATRNFFAEEITKAKKHTVGLGRVLGALRFKDPNNSDKRIQATINIVGKIESAMTKFGFETARVDIKMPVKAHVKLLREAEEVFVAIAPLVDEKDVDKVIAFSKGKRLELDASNPPTVPTLVVTRAGPQSHDPGYPIPVVKEPGEKGKEEGVDDYIGIRYIKILDDHENWWWGDPEIYVLVHRFNNSIFSIYTTMVPLPGVNEENEWYDLGDRYHNQTYQWVDTGLYGSAIQLEFWESDKGEYWFPFEAEGEDDFLGVRLIWWKNLPFWTYTEYVTGDVRFKIDRVALSL